MFLHSIFGIKMIFRLRETLVLFLFFLFIFNSYIQQKVQSAQNTNIKRQQQKNNTMQKAKRRN